MIICNLAISGVGDISTELRFDAEVGIIRDRCVVGGVDAEVMVTATGVGIGAAGTLRAALGVTGINSASAPIDSDDEEGGGENRATEEAGEENAEMSTSFG
jgi:hypothetical protein